MARLISLLFFECDRYNFLTVSEISIFFSNCRERGVYLFLLGNIFALLLVMAVCHICGIFLFKVFCRANALENYTKYFSPILGAAFLIVYLSICFRVQKYIPVDIFYLHASFLALMMLYLWRKGSLRQYISTEFHVSALFFVVVSFTVFAPIYRYGLFVPAGGDAYMYTTVAQAAFRAPFFAPILLPAGGGFEFYPNLALVRSWQNLDSKLGAMFLLTFFMKILRIEWSYEAYPVVYAFGLAAGCYALVGAIRLVTNTRAGMVPYLVGIAAGLTANGFSWGAVMGFYPQTFGVPLALVTLLLGIVLLRAALQTDLGSGAIAAQAMLPAITISALVYSYSEILYPVGFVGLVVAVAEMLRPANRTPQSLRRAGIFLAAFLLFLVLLANFELYRMLKLMGLLLSWAQTSYAVGWPFPWEHWEFLAFTIGMRPQFEDFITRYFGVTFANFTELRMILAGLSAVFGGVLIYALARQRHLLRQPAFLILLVFPLLCLFVLLPYFRYAVPSPWPIGQGQSFLQMRAATWSSLFCYGLIGIALLSIAAAGPVRRFAVLAFLLVWIAAGAAFHFDFANVTNRGLIKETDGGGFARLLQVRAYLKPIPANEPIFLDLPYFSATEAYLRYVLWDRQLVGYWRNAVVSNDLAFFCQAKWTLRYAKPEDGAGAGVAQRVDSLLVLLPHGPKECLAKP
ncbi:hypothetical protein [Ferrovibrio sp.]|uniref:hypothetical protein n=1 Tax=Ferrovibrio sp. TaxID=1917215 RepID=UPI001B57B713|nr:hypothetical protein [Ferrovibrio sp.]MBP7065558.1 hypothetical protein [Ferrovibrio sp.]